MIKNFRAQTPVFRPEKLTPIMPKTDPDDEAQRGDE